MRVRIADRSFNETGGITGKQCTTIGSGLHVSKLHAHGGILALPFEAVDVQ